MSALAVFFVAFLASAVEMVEAATIVLAIELTRGRRAAFTGALSALALLIAGVLIFQPLVASVPLAPLRLVVGGLALLFGLDWLRKAILRAGGVKALHDEAAIFAAETQSTSGVVSSQLVGVDRLGFVVAFKAVLLEGLEAVVIVLTLGSAQQHMKAAVGGAFVALITVIAAAAVLRKPLARVPENTMKLTVGILLVAFGTFWSAEGAGVHWPGDALAIPVLAAWYGLLALLLASKLRATAQVAS